MNPEAIEAATEAYFEGIGDASYQDAIRMALEAAAPYLIREALRDAAHALAGDGSDTHWDKLNAEFKADGGGRRSLRDYAYLDGLEESREFLLARAAAIRAGEA